jgi:uncharacterized membrane protein
MNHTLASRAPALPATQRLLSLDQLRGLLMVLMALDHAVFFLTRLHTVGEFWGGPYPGYDSALTFLVRWVTHLSATGFSFLLGVGKGLGARSKRRQGWGWAPIIGQFVLRALLLVAVQMVLVNRAWELSPSGWVVKWYFGVLFALGGGLLLTAPLSGLKPWVHWLLALLLLAACAWFGPRPEDWQHYLPVWKRFALVPGGDRTLWVSFPALSWLPPLLLGLAFAGWLQADAERAMRRALLLGLVFLAAFAGLRLTDGFFNIRPARYRSWIDYLNVVKYPPSITFLLLTMGLDLLLLRLFHALRGVRLPRILPAYGRAALFFYVLHLFLFMAMGRLAGRHGVGIDRMFLLWILGLALLYLPCLWYGRMRQRQPSGSLLRLL